MRASEPSRRIDVPEPGYFLIRKVKNGPYVPAAIRYEDGKWFAEVDGVKYRNANADPHLADGVMRIWQGGRQCDEGEYAYRLALKQWAVKHNPDHPAANPDRPIDSRLLPPPF